MTAVEKTVAWPCLHSWRLTGYSWTPFCDPAQPQWFGQRLRPVQFLVFLRLRQTYRPKITTVPYPNLDRHPNPRQWSSS